MSPIDRAARALATSQGGEGVWDLLDAAHREKLKEGVRHMLRALRDPDERMSESGAEIVRNVGSGESQEAYRSDAANTWRYMIDALLDEDG